ncbi:MAG: hypothetical protein ACOX1W_00775 [Catenisphaera adipataccumulans]|jgi:exopolyphosphatase/guanosine-5'-triphosphate,3'-diphosphate pyrophosphatase|uniref:Ppx/GppA phosphatase family protein n=1 Tax=Catenisphaera adipataccumulans TaxID=700500 RepID=UPI003D8DC6E3
MLYGIIDIGSNTVRLNIYRIEGENFHVLLSRKESVGLAAYVKKKKLTEEGIHALIDCLSGFKELMRVLNIDGYSAFATASLRNIDNTDDVLSQVFSVCRMRINMLTGSEEGELSFHGAMTALDFETGVYIDTGGGSTEILTFNKENMKFLASIPVGSLNLFNNYVNQLIPTKKEMDAMRSKVKDEFKENIPEKVFSDNLVVTGGSMRAIRLLLVRLKMLDEKSYELNADVLHALVKELLSMDTKDVMRLFLKVKADRVHTMMPGLVIIDTIAQIIHAKNVQISNYGVREGYLQERVLGDLYTSA